MLHLTHGSPLHYFGNCISFIQFVFIINFLSLLGGRPMNAPTDTHILLYIIWSGNTDFHFAIHIPDHNFQLSIFNFQFNKQVWRNWQTRMVQVHVKAISCRFKSCYLHQQPFLMQGRLFCIAFSVCFMVIFKIFELIFNKKRKLCWQIRKYGI